MSQRKIICLASLALFCAPTIAQGSLVPYLPKNTILVVSAPDLKSSMADFGKTPMAKMWREAEVQTFLADAIEFAKGKIEEGKAQAKEMHAQGSLPIDPEKLLQLEIGGVTGAVTELDIAVGDFGPMPKLGLVLHVDFGNSQKTWKELIDMGLGMLEGQAGEHMLKTETKVGDMTILSMMPNDAGAPEMGLNVAMLPNGILITTLPSDIKSIVENMQSQTPALGATPLYGAMVQRVKAPGAEIQTFMRLDPLVQFAVKGLRIGTEMSPELAEVDMDGVERALVAMGMRNLGAFAEAGSYVDGKSVTRSSHVTEPSATTAAAGKSLDMSFLKWIPKDSVSFSAWSWDVASIFDTLKAGLEAYNPEFAVQALGELAKIEGQLGFKVREDLFGSFGDHGITWSMAVSTIAAMPETAMLLKVTDEKKLVTVLKNAAQLSQGMVEFEEGEKRGIQVYSLRVNFDPTGGMGMNPFDMITPTFAFKSGYMVAGFSVGDIKRVFQRMDREDDPKGDIRGNKEFATVASTIPASVSSVSFTDWKTQFESFYQLGTGLLALVPIGEEVPIDMSLLPDSSTLTQHLFGSVSYSTSTATGTDSVSTSPWGPEMALVLGAVVAGVAGFASARRF